METLVVLFILFTVLSLLGRGQQKRPPPPPAPGASGGPAALPPEQVIQVRVGGRTLSFPAPAGGSGEESWSEGVQEEPATGYDLTTVPADAEPGHDLQLGESYDLHPEVLAPVLPGQPVSMETEVDRDLEHAAFHRRYVDTSPPVGTATRGLLDDLRDPHMLRRAVLAAEILAPPRSLREWPKG